MLQNNLLKLLGKKTSSYYISFKDLQEIISNYEMQKRGGLQVKIISIK